eukprot:TRINITY_DN16567_c0_g1_i1.p1 TRINITY_DN16567_c0_g1~~TRINITY_DN16567_c0_g1_i1.p1  ORF type:complete len:631 (-),score=187.51 TRINITY_DN16567_c0_g1_i1:118-1938(-)
MASKWGVLKQAHQQTVAIKALEKNAAEVKVFEVGDHVIADSIKKNGVVAFYGTTQFAEGTWVGIKLATPEGKNDGSVKGVRYFDCPDKHGLFVRPALCELDPAKLVNKEPKAGSTLAPPAKTKPGEDAPQARASTVSNRPSNEVARELAEAIEEHDSHAITRLLPEAISAGVNQREIKAAESVLHFRGFKQRQAAEDLCFDMQEVEGAIKRIGTALEVLENRAQAIRGNLEKEKRPSLSSENSLSTSGLEQLLKTFTANLEQQIVNKVEACLPSIVRQAVMEGTSEALENKIPVQADENYRQMELLRLALEEKSEKLTKLFEKPANQESRAEAEAAAANALFSALDKDGDGIITQEEFAQMDAALAAKDGETAGDNDDPELKAAKEKIQAALFAALDKDGDGVITREEFQQMQAGLAATQDVVGNFEAEETKAATKIQALRRGKMARREQDARTKAACRIQAIMREKLRGKKLCLASAAIAVVRRKGRMEDIFWAHADSLGKPDLNETAFVSAIRKACPRIYRAQAQAIWKGYTEGTGKRRVDSKCFCKLGQAIEEGDHIVAEFADISVDDFQDLAVSEQEAAQRIQNSFKKKKEKAKNGKDNLDI